MRPEQADMAPRHTTSTSAGREAGPALSAHDLAIDHQMAQISTSFQFLSSLTPINAREARKAYLADGTPPEFVYAELPVDPDVVEAQLADIDVSTIEDATVRHLLTRKHRELDLQVEMLRARGSEGFLPLSIELFGGITPRLRERAEALLAWVPNEPETIDQLDAEAFLAMARDEIDHYRSCDPSVAMHAELSEEAAGVAVQGDTLVVPATTHVEARRAQALIQHEVGTHLVTRANGAAQPLKVLGAGLAGYDETQEGLAVLAELACGGLTAPRLRTLAARVVTAHRRVERASFGDCVSALVDAGFTRTSAFTTTMRVFRSGGFTKDAVYLRGLTDLLDHVAAGGVLDLMWLGKFHLHDLPMVEELWDRGILTPPRVCPRYLTVPQAQQRIERAAHADSLIDIVQEGQHP